VLLKPLPICWCQFHSRMQLARNKSKAAVFKNRRTWRPNFKCKGRATGHPKIHSDTMPRSPALLQSLGYAPDKGESLPTTKLEPPKTLRKRLGHTFVVCFKPRLSATNASQALASLVDETAS
jgi:hypothetical protein